MNILAAIVGYLTIGFFGLILFVLLLDNVQLILTLNKAERATNQFKISSIFLYVYIFLGSPFYFKFLNNTIFNRYHRWTINYICYNTKFKIKRNDHFGNYEIL